MKQNSAFTMMERYFDMSARVNSLRGGTGGMGDILSMISPGAAGMGNMLNMMQNLQGMQNMDMSALLNMMKK